MLRLLAILLIAASPLWAGGGSAKSESQAAEPAAEELAVDHYNQGLKYRDKAWKLEEQAAAAKKPQDRAKRLAQAQEEYKKALEQQLAATALNADFHEAFSSLGYAYRKIGQYAPALEAYDRALALAPNYVEAIEYRAEAYLGLGRLSETKAAYETLFLRDPQRAANVLTACGKWVQAALAAGEVEQVAEFAVWVAAKKATARTMNGADGDGQKEW